MPPTEQLPVITACSLDNCQDNGGSTILAEILSKEELTTLLAKGKVIATIQGSQRILVLRSRGCMGECTAERAPGFRRSDTGTTLSQAPTCADDVLSLLKDT